MSKDKWFLVTNTENLEYYFDCNMLVEIQAFGKNSYVRDIQAKRPIGYIIISAQSNLSEAIKEATSEDPNLIACLIEIDLHGIKFNKAYARELNGFYRSVSCEKLEELSIDELLIPSPLPISIIKNIVLKDVKDKNHCEKNISSSFGKFSKNYFLHNSKLFETKKKLGLPDELGQDLLSTGVIPAVNNGLQDIQPIFIDYQRAFSVGGALSLAYYQTKNGRKSCDLFKYLVNEDNSVTSTNEHLSSLKNWVYKPHPSSDLDLFFKQVLDISSAESDFGTIQHYLLQYFENKNETPEKYSKVSGLAKRLRQIIEKTYDGDLNSYFRKLINHYESEGMSNSKPYLLISMIFIRDHIETALKFYHEDFTEDDYFLIATFYGLFRGIKRVPTRIREILHLRDWVSHQMAQFLSNQIGSQVQFTKTPESLILIHEKHIKTTTNTKAQDKLQRLLSHLKINEDDVLIWLLNTKGEYTVKGSTISFASRPKLTADIQHDLLEKAIQLNTIKLENELCEINRLLEILEA